MTNLYKMTINTLKRLCLDNDITIKSKMNKKDLINTIITKEIQDPIINNYLEEDKSKNKTSIKTSVKRCSKKISKKNCLENLIQKINNNVSETQTLQADVCEKNPNFFKLDKFMINSKGIAVGTCNNDDKLVQEDVEHLLEIGIPVDVDAVALKMTLENICEECAGILNNCSKCLKIDIDHDLNDVDFDNDIDNDDVESDDE